MNDEGQRRPSNYSPSITGRIPFSLPNRTPIPARPLTRRAANDLPSDLPEMFIRAPAPSRAKTATRPYPSTAYRDVS